MHTSVRISEVNKIRDNGVFAASEVKFLLSFRNFYSFPAVDATPNAVAHDEIASARRANVKDKRVSCARSSIDPIERSY